MDVREIIAGQSEWVRRTTLETFAELNTGERLFQAAPGVNHALWLLGHIAGSENHLILGFCKGESLLPATYGKLFGMGSKLLDDPTGYPSGEEILERLGAVHEASLEYLRTVGDDELAQPPVSYDKLPERARQLFGTRLKCLCLAPNHEAMHSGQMSYIRRLLGKPFRI
jgi:uncharacterized damage-inducible protein DinB